MNLPLLLALTLLGTPPEGVEFHEGTWQSALDRAAKEKKLVFADFYTDW